MKEPNKQSVILFYKYGLLSSKREIMEPYREAMVKLCTSLSLNGRILIGLSDQSEGINGTLAGLYSDVYAFTIALHGKKYYDEKYNYNDSELNSSMSDRSLQILNEFWQASEDFAKAANIPIFIIDSPEDFKWSFPSTSESSNNSDDSLFPDLNIKLVSEIISTGGKLSSITVEDTSVGYLTPEEWHQSMQKNCGTTKPNTFDNVIEKKSDNVVLIDCRNQKEVAIGHFDGALDPKTKTFEQFPQWVDNHKSQLRGKEIYMYCTGGIRCEKASAYVRNAIEEVKDDYNTTQVYHLKGGIHKYIEKYGSDGFFHGKNFVFDRRGADDPSNSKNTTVQEQTETEYEKNIVGKCIYCDKPWDTFTPDSVCTVCREPTLVCVTCREKVSPKGEYHCEDHAHLKHCYFTNLSCFSQKELHQQQNDLEQLKKEIAIGKKFKQKRKTLQKQLEKIKIQLEVLAGGNGSETVKLSNASVCRNCGEKSCTGNCWGFHGLARKQKMDRDKGLACEETSTHDVVPHSSKIINDTQEKNRNRPSASQRNSKLKQKEYDIAEIRRLKLSLPPSSCRDPATSLRCPPPCTRMLQTRVKGKWCGKNAIEVLKSEFSALSNDQTLNELLDRSLIHINNNSMKPRNYSLQEFSNEVCLKNMDVIGRIVHWHEPPVMVPSSISVQKVSLPKVIRDNFIPNIKAIDEGDLIIYCCDKPSTIPVHPAGPYLSNTLTLMVEAQESLEPRSLLPCHRLDRVTSGLTLCCTSPDVARLLQCRMNMGDVSKLYVSKVKGKFPDSESECQAIQTIPNDNSTLRNTWKWYGKDDETNFVEVNASIETVDPGNGVRAVTEKGKESRSRFKYISYDSESDTSLIACYPITGRGHQLRVHLQWIGFPIYNDIQYGGDSYYSSDERGNNQQWKDTVIQHILKSCENETQCTESDGCITERDAQNAREVCLSRQGEAGILSSFTPAQLLQEGHSIALHALKYMVKFAKKSKKRKAPCDDDANESTSVIEEVMEFSTKLPVWAASIGDDHDFTWIKSLYTKDDLNLVK